VHDDGEGVLIGRGSRLAHGRVLGGRVRGPRSLFGGGRGVPQQPADCEARQERPSGLVHEDGAGPEVAVHDAPPVRVLQRARDLLHDPQAGLDVEGAALLEHGGQRPLPHALGGGPEQVGRRAEAQHRDDVRVIEHGRRVHLLLEPLFQLRLTEEAPRQHPERHPTVSGRLARGVEDRPRLLGDDRVDLELARQLLVRGLVQRVAHLDLQLHAPGGIAAQHARMRFCGDLGDRTARADHGIQR
jgi:hypothetical protein